MMRRSGWYDHASGGERGSNGYGYGSLASPSSTSATPGYYDTEYQMPSLKQEGGCKSQTISYATCNSFIQLSLITIWD